MKNSMKALAMLSAGLMLVGCVENGVYSNDYYSSGSAPSYQEQTSYSYPVKKHHRSSKRGYSSSQNVPHHPAPATGGYNSTGQSPVSSHVSQPSVQPSLPPAPQPTSAPVSSDGGYSSNAGNAASEAPAQPVKPAEMTPEQSSSSPATGGDGGYSSSN